MNLKNCISLLSVCSLLMFASSCKKDYVFEETQRTPLGKVDQLFSTITGESFSRINVNSWQNTDAIGITMLRLKDSVVVNYNKKYMASPGGNFAPENGQVINYPTDGTLTNLVAYYPYQATADSVYKVDITAQTNPDALDLMYASNATNYSSVSTTAPYLQFQHQLSKVELKIRPAAGEVMVMKDMEVTFKDINAKADFNLKNANFDNPVVGEVHAVVKPTVVELTTPTPHSDTTQVATIIAIPGSISGKLVEVKLATGKIFTWYFPAATNIAKGNSYSFNVTLVPDPPVSIFTEGFGTTPPTGNPVFNIYTGYDNGKGLTITGNGQVRAAGNGFTTNAGRFANTQQNLKIEGINTIGHNNLKLKFRVSLATAPAAGGLNFNNIITLSYNGHEYALPDSIATSASRVFALEVNLNHSSAAAAATNTIEIIGNKGFTTQAPGTYFFRLDDVSIEGRKD